jgi:hypothetical protein
MLPRQSGYQGKRRHGIVPQSEGPTRHVGTRRDSKWDTILEELRAEGVW